MQKESDNQHLLNSHSDTKNRKRKGKLSVVYDLTLTQIYPNCSNGTAFRNIFFNSYPKTST